MHRNTLTGGVYALAAHTIWGLLPVYWKALDHVNVLEILAHRIVWSVPLQLSTVGLVAYVTPSLQFSIGAFVYREPIAGSDLISFGLIWAGLAVYTLEGQQQARKSVLTRAA